MNNDAIQLQSIDAKCPTCGNNYKYSPEDASLKCEKCASLRKIEKTNETAKKTFDDVDDSPIIAWKQQEKYIKCKSCGSTVELKNNEISIDCPYCESQNVVLKEDIEGLYPDKLLPFKFGKTEAGEQFVKSVKKKFYVPRPFKKRVPESEIEGFYFPTFEFDADSHSTYSGRLYRNKTVGSGKNARTVRVYFNISGKIDYKHRNVLVESSKRMSQKKMDDILPYEFDAITDFKPDYLFGYTVEQYDEPFSNAVANSEKIFNEQIRNAILKKYTYNGVSSLDIKSTFSNKGYSYDMMPVYSFDYNYKNKKYSTFMNGQTGKLGGGLPISKIKVAFTVIIVLIIVIGIIALSTLAGE